jgi:Holliday junction resolvasome RuvABC DNA-binding subunit
VIASLSGVYRARVGESIVLEVGGVGYLVYLPPVVWEALGELHPEQPLHFKIVYQASAQQPKPTLFGFLSEAEKEFFELLAGIPRMGGRNAARAMVLPVNTLAAAIQ